MRHARLVVLSVFVLLLSSCGVFGGDDEGTDLSTDEAVAAEPTTNNVQPIQVDPTATMAPAAAAPLPTAVAIPPTEVPPAPTPDRSQPISYVVQSGDVLGLIAERFDVDIALLRSENDLNGNLITVGQTLVIPPLGGSTELAAPEAAPTSAPSTSSEPAAPVTCAAGAVGHCVQSGESLLGIASQYGVTVDALRAANPSITGDLISIGSVLAIPGQATSNPDPTPSTPDTGSVTLEPTTVLLPATNAQCLAANPEFPYFHEGKCYANPIGGVPTDVPATATVDPTVECPTGYILWDDGRCYPFSDGGTTTPIPATVVATATPTDVPDYGTAPCRDGYEQLENGRCWPAPGTTPATVVPTS